jgi:hypothetical protein
LTVLELVRVWGRVARNEEFGYFCGIARLGLISIVARLTEKPAETEREEGEREEGRETIDVRCTYWWQGKCVS